MTKVVEQSPFLPGPFSKVLILDELTPEAVIAGYVLKKIGVIDPATDPVVRADTRASTELGKEAYPLYNYKNINPGKLSHWVDGSTIPKEGKFALKRYLELSECYRWLGEGQWWRLCDPSGTTSPALRNLHRLLVTDLLKHPDPEMGFVTCFETLDDLAEYGPYRYEDELDRRAYLELNGYPNYMRQLEKPQYNLPFIPEDFRVTKLKNRGGEPDIVEDVSFNLNRGRIQLLKKAHTLIAICGSPRSGKTTSTASFYFAALEEVQRCVRDGILDNGEVVLGAVELDLVSPTLEAVIFKKKPTRDPNLRWNDELVRTGVRKIERARKDLNLAFLDMPGGNPDQITAAFARRADFSILIEKGYHQDSRMWIQYLLGESLPTHLVHAHTKYGESGRVSGLKTYEARSSFDKYDYLKGRIVDLDRAPKPTDDFIKFATAVLLYDYLPGTIMKRDSYRANLARSLGEDG